MLTRDWRGPNPKGLAEVTAITRTHVKSAAFVRADLTSDSYALTFRAPSEAPAKERALAEMEQALNTHRVPTTDATGIDLQFE